MDSYSYTCVTCGKVHTGIPDLGFDSPHYYHVLSDEQRRQMAVLTSDTCVIDNEDYFVRCRLDIPVHGQSQTLCYGVWVSLSKENFTRYEELYESTDRHEVYFGWLSSRLPGYPETLALKTNIHLRPWPQRPAVELEPTDHPLAREQADGITLDRLYEIMELNGHTIRRAGDSIGTPRLAWWRNLLGRLVR